MRIRSARERDRSTYVAASPYTMSEKRSKTASQLTDFARSKHVSKSNLLNAVATPTQLPLVPKGLHANNLDNVYREEGVAFL